MKPCKYERIATNIETWLPSSECNWPWRLPYEKNKDEQVKFCVSRSMLNTYEYVHWQMFGIKLWSNYTWTFASRSRQWLQAFLIKYRTLKSKFSSISQPSELSSDFEHQNTYGKDTILALSQSFIPHTQPTRSSNSYHL